MKIGLLKSKIEKYLIESYKNKTLKNTMFVFNELVLENKNLSKIFFLYDNLSERKNLNESTANELINQSIVIYENSFNKLSKKELNDLNLWVGHIKTENQYSDIDNLFSSSVLTLEEKIKSKKTIVENLKSQNLLEQDLVKAPLNVVVETANKTVKNFIDSLEESNKKILLKILNEDENKLETKYEILKETVTDKLQDLKSNESDNDIIKTINETITKLEKETFDRINYFKLFELNKNL
jgi:hypothetical protein